MPRTVVVCLHGRALPFKGIDETVTVTYSEYEPIVPRSPPREGETLP